MSAAAIPQPKRAHALFDYGVTAALALGVAAWTLRLWRADLRLPFEYRGDALLVLASIKNLGTDGWYWHGHLLGAPGGQQLFDFPLGVDAQMAVIKLFTLFGASAPLAANLYFLLTFPLTALAACFVLRRWTRSPLVAIAVSVVYAALPFHFARGLHHLFLSGYQCVPLAAYAAMRTWTSPPFLEIGTDGKRRLSLRRRADWHLLAIAALTGCSIVYYAYFFCYLLGVMSLLASVRAKSWAPAKSGAVLLAATLATATASFLPTALYRFLHGPNLEVAARVPAESEYYAFKLAQLVLPAPHHRIAGWAALRALYDQGPLPSEEGLALGLLGTVGLVLLLIHLLAQRPAADDSELLSGLSVGGLSTLLLGTLGGLGSVIAYLVSPMMRANNRVIVFLAFFCLAAVALVADRALSRWGNGWARLAVGAVAILSILDQTNLAQVPDYARNAAAFTRDRAFVQGIESTLGPGAMVLQLPFRPFPEYPAQHDLSDYDLLRPYLHSDTLRWSHGAMKGRDTSRWNEAVAGLQPADMIAVARRAGFTAVYLDREGYADGGRDLEAAISSITGRAPVVREDGAVSWFDLRGPGASPLPDPSRLPVQVIVGGGCHELEGGPHGTRWCGAKGEIALVNLGPLGRRVRVAGSFSAARPEGADLWITGPWIEEIDIGPAERPFSREITVPPGVVTLRLSSSGRRLIVPGDTRELVFRLADLSVEPLD